MLNTFFQKLEFRAVQQTEQDALVRSTIQAVKARSPSPKTPQTSTSRASTPTDEFLEDCRPQFSSWFDEADLMKVVEEALLAPLRTAVADLVSGAESAMPALSGENERAELEQEVSCRARKPGFTPRVVLRAPSAP